MRLYKSVNDMRDIDVYKVFHMVKNYMKTYGKTITVHSREVVYLDYYVVSNIDGNLRGFEDELVYKMKSYKIGEEPEDFYIGMNEKTFSIYDKRSFLSGMDINKINEIYTIESANKVLRKEDLKRNSLNNFLNIISMTDYEIVDLFYAVKEYLKRSGEVLELNGYRVKYIDFHVVREVQGEQFGFQNELVYVGKSYSDDKVEDVYMGMNEKSFIVSDMRKFLENIKVEILERIVVSLTASTVLGKNK